jgi:four helix bundle protein
MATPLGFRDLKVYQQAYQLAMEIFRESKSFPKEEKYSLTDQIRRASRSVPANIAEGYRKKRYPKMFVSKMVDADGEATETQVWLDFARDCGYLTPQIQAKLTKGYEEIGRMLGRMILSPERFSSAVCLLPSAVRRPLLRISPTLPARPSCSRRNRPPCRSNALQTQPAI